jgi:hypothetical protein
MAEYDVLVLCNACGDLHPMGSCVSLQDGPSSKQSITDVYAGEDLPSNLAELKDKRIYCPKTGRQYSQKDNKKVFLVPVGLGTVRLTAVNRKT